MLFYIWQILVQPHAFISPFPASVIDNEGFSEEAWVSYAK